MAFAASGHATDLQAANRATGIPASEYLAVEFRLPQDARNSVEGSAHGGTPDRLRVQLGRTSANSSLRSSGNPASGAVIGLPIAARFVFELTGTPDGGGSVSRSMAGRTRHLDGDRAARRNELLSHAYTADPRDRGE